MKKVKVFSNLAISIDGKISSFDRKSKPFGTPLDRKEMMRIRNQSDVVVIGASTLRADKTTCQPRGFDKTVANVVISNKLEGISPSWSFFKNPKIKRFLFITGRPKPATLDKFIKSCEIVRVKPNRVAKSIVSHLADRGLRRILVEGGGSVMWEFAKDDLLDELNVTLTPLIVGGHGAPSLVDGTGLRHNQLKRFKLKKSKVVGNEIYLRYSR